MKKICIIGIIAIVLFLSGCIEQGFNELSNCMAKCQEICTAVNEKNINLEGFDQLSIEKINNSLTINCSCPCSQNGKPYGNVYGGKTNFKECNNNTECIPSCNQQDCFNQVLVNDCMSPYPDSFECTCKNNTCQKIETKYNCETDSDCVFAENCQEFDLSPACVNNDWWFKNYAIGLYNCPPLSSKGCACEQKKCIKKTNPGIQITTDKIEYSLDENRIVLTIKNNSQNSIFYQTINWSCMPAIISKPEYLKLLGKPIYPEISDHNKWFNLPAKEGMITQPQCGYETLEIKAGETISTDYWPKYFHDQNIFTGKVFGFPISSYKIGFDFATNKNSYEFLGNQEDFETTYSNDFKITKNGNTHDCDWLEPEIKKLAEELKYCEKDSDCILEENISPNCAIGCYVIRSNRFDNTKKLEILIEDNIDYLKKCPICELECMALPEKLSCRSNKCIEVKP